jgi:hypothetical protein
VRLTWLIIPPSEALLKAAIVSATRAPALVEPGHELLRPAGSLSRATATFVTRLRPHRPTEPLVSYQVNDNFLDGTFLHWCYAPSERTAVEKRFAGSERVTSIKKMSRTCNIDSNNNLLAFVRRRVFNNIDHFETISRRPR